MRDGRDGRWLGTSPCDNERTIASRTDTFRAYDGKSSELILPGPWARVGTVQLNWVNLLTALRDLLAFRRPESTCAAVAGVVYQLKAMADSTAAGGARAQGAGGVHPASWARQRGGGRAGGRLKPGVKVTVGGYRPPRLGGDVVTFDVMREFLVACLEYEQQMHVVNENGGDRVPAKRRELVDPVTQPLVADGLYYGKPWIDLSEQELQKGLQTFAGVDSQQTSDVDFCRQICRVLNGSRVPVDSRALMQKVSLQ